MPALDVDVGRLMQPGDEIPCEPLIRKVLG